MSLTILDVLRNAETNLVANIPTAVGMAVGREQLTNAVKLLEEDYDLHADFDKSWAEFKEASGD